MTTSRTGKIARLPRALREQLNRRLANHEPADPLLAWLNALPEVKAILTAQFQGNPISKQNLSDWRLGGFAEWEYRQEFANEALMDIQEVKADSEQMDLPGQEYLADSLGNVLCARYATLIARWNGEVTPELEHKLRFLHRLCVDITALRRSLHSSVRTDMAREAHQAQYKPRPRAPQSSPACRAEALSEGGSCPVAPSPSATNPPATPDQALEPSTPAIGAATARRHNPADATSAPESAALPSPAAGESCPIVPGQAYEDPEPVSVPPTRLQPAPTAAPARPPSGPAAPLIRIHPLPFPILPPRYTPPAQTQDDEW